MYTNINTEDSIACISKYLHQEETCRHFSHKNPEAIVVDMPLVMRNNRMRFGNIIVHQTKGIAMGMSPAPTIANLFVAIFEAKHIAPLFGTYLRLLRRLIYSGFEVWIHDSGLRTRHQRCQLAELPSSHQRNGTLLGVHQAQPEDHLHGPDNQIH